MAITVKFLAKTSPDQDSALWTSLIAGGGRQVGNVAFTFDIDARDYDFLVVYEGLPPLLGEKKVNRIERLACHQQNTLLMTTEPASIRIDGPHFLRQFGHIWTNKAPELVRHPHQYRETPPLRWFYGRPMGGAGEYKSFDEMASGPALFKNKDLSTVCSTKQMSHTVHAKRLEFVMALSERLPELDVFGRGIQPIDEKSEAMDAYKYHIAIENHIEAGHWTEKLADCFLARCLPFYFGDPEYAKAFPKDAVIPIDIYDMDGAIEIIQTAIHTRQYEKRKSALETARQITLEKYNTISAITKFIEANYVASTAASSEVIYGRHVFRSKHPLRAAQDAVFRARMTKHSAAAPLQT